MPVTMYFVVVSSRQPHGPAGVQFLSTYADLGAKTELLTVGEARRRIDHYRGCVNLSGEPLGGLEVASDDGFGMARAVTLDMGDGAIEVVHHPHTENEVQVFLAPIILRGRLDGAGYRPCLFVADQPDAVQRVNRSGKEIGGNVAMKTSDSVALQTLGR